MKHPWKQSALDPLLGLGLTKNQAVLYLTAWHGGLMTASELARATGINRQQVYADAEKLISLGLFDITRRQRKKFLAAEPSALATLSERRRAEAGAAAEQLTASLPMYEALRATSKSRVSVKYFEDASRLREAYLQELARCKNTEVLSFTGSVEDLYRFFPENYWQKWNKRFVENGNRSRMLVHRSAAAAETARHDHVYHRETRFLEPFPLKVNVDVFGSTVLIVSFYDELAVWIDSAIMADSYRVLFETCWKNAKAF